MKKLAVCAAFVLLSSTAYPNDHSANEMLPYCKALANGNTEAMANLLKKDINKTSDLFGVCYGVVETLVIVLDVNHLVCFPKGVTYSQASKIMIRYMEEHPQFLHVPYAAVGMEALKET